MFVRGTYVVRLLFVLISLLVSGSLGLIRHPLLLRKRLPSLTENLADLSKRHTRILFANVLTLLIGKEHIGRKTALGGIGIYHNV